MGKVWAPGGAERLTRRPAPAQRRLVVGFWAEILDGDIVEGYVFFWVLNQGLVSLYIHIIYHGRIYRKNRCVIEYQSKLLMILI